MQILLVSDGNFLTPSIQSTAGHLTPVEQICQGQNPQTPGSRLDAHQYCPSFPTAMALFRPPSSDHQPQAEAKNAFKNLLVRNFRT
ncbi:MAG: hypothetical protein ACYTXT_40550 [Nostoc sp.]